MRHEVIVFDFFGVVCSEVAPFWLRNYFSEPESVEVKRTIVQAADVGVLSQDQLFTKLGEMAGIPAAQVEYEWWSYVVIDWTMVELVRSIGRSRRVALLTNSPARFVRCILKKYDIDELFEVILVSSEQGCAKPHHDIYRELLHRLEVDPSSVLFIDDNPINIKGAKELGIDGVVFTSSANLKRHLSQEN